MQHLCSHLDWLNSVVVFLHQDKNGNEYDKDLEMEIHPVIKACANKASMLDGEMYWETNWVQ